MDSLLDYIYWGCSGKLGKEGGWVIFLRVKSLGMFLKDIGSYWRRLSKGVTWWSCVFKFVIMGWGGGVVEIGGREVYYGKIGRKMDK